MPKTDIWTGPALSNPRNKRGSVRSTRISIQHEELRHSLTRLERPDSDEIEILEENGTVLRGRLDLSDLVIETLEQKLRFHLWTIPTTDSTRWRTVYACDVDLAQDQITIETVSIAPDHDNEFDVPK